MSNAEFAARGIEAAKAFMERIAVSYLKEHDFGDCRVRFDILSLLLFNENKALLRHHINAFGGDPID